MDDNTKAIHDSFMRMAEEFNTRRLCEIFGKAIMNGDFTNKMAEKSLVVRMINELIYDQDKLFQINVPSDTVLFRARAVLDVSDFCTEKTGVSAGYADANDNRGTPFISTGFDKYGSKEAPMGKTPPARNNISGMSYLYLAEDPYTACSEIRPYLRSIISLAQFKTKNELKLMDFSPADTVNLSSLMHLGEKLKPDGAPENISVRETIIWIMRQFAQTVGKPEQYRVSQYISDYIRKAGFDGIRYSSSLTGGKNITLFNSHEANIQFVSSKLVYSLSQKYQIMDINSGEQIPVVDNADEWNQERLNSIRITIMQAVHQANSRNGNKAK